MTDAAILRGYRTEHAKAVRRKYGDNSGKCKFSDRYFMPATDGCSNALTSVLKDNLVIEFNT